MLLVKSVFFVHVASTLDDVLEIPSGASDLRHARSA